MKKTIYFFIALLLVFSACNKSEILDVDQQMVLTEDKHFQSYSDIFRAYWGTYALLQDVVEQHFVLGDVRTDLVDVNSGSPKDLEDVYNFSADKNNKYFSPQNYIRIIINCNTNLFHLEIMLKDNKIDKQNYAGFKQQFVAIRSWVYYQLAINYDKVPYFIKEVSKTSDLDSTNFLLINNKDVLRKVLGDLETVSDSIFSDFNKNVVELNVNAIKGDIYLTLAGDTNVTYYEKAAKAYFKVINNYPLISSLYTGNTSDYFKMFSQSNISEVISYVFFYQKLSEGIRQDNPLMSIMKNYLSSSSVIKDYWESQSTLIPDYSFDYARQASFTEKYKMAYNYYMFYRVANIHLRYAEAVNRMGRSDLALAILNGDIMVKSGTTNYVSKGEGPYSLRAKYSEFDSSKFVGMFGVRGRLNLNRISIDSTKSPQEIMIAVEDTLLAEMAMESAFEGLRWADLVRVADRRNDPTYLAKKVYEKMKNDGSSNASKVQVYLNERKNWEIKMTDYIKQ